MKARKRDPLSAGGAAQALEGLLEGLPPALVAEAMELAKARLKITPQKLSLMLVRVINPDEILGEGEEAVLRGVARKTLRDMKHAKEVPPVVNG